MKKIWIISAFLLTTTLLTGFSPSVSAQQSNKDIRLVLQITVDGLRTDLLSRYTDRFNENGFLFLKQHGIVFANAHYQHANTETIVGHSTLATGAQPSVHGMTGNVWLDAESGELAYNIEDENYPLLPTRKKTKTGDQDEVATALAKALTLKHGIYLAITPKDVEQSPDSKLLHQIRNNIHPVRSGDIYVVQDPYWFNFDKGPIAAMHGSPWNYDTHVPVIFAGAGIDSGIIYRRVQPADVAPTLCALLGMSPPASAQGTVLPEVLSDAE